MESLELSDRLALDMLCRSSVLDALCNWAKNSNSINASYKTLPDILWKSLEEFAANKYVDHSQVHVNGLIDVLRRDSGQPLIIALKHMVRRHFVWHDRAMLRYETVLQTQFWLAKCNPVQPQCYLWAIDAPTRSSIARLRNLPDELKREFYSDAPSLPEVDEWNLHALRHHGLAEIHRHLNGSALPSYLWSYLLSAPNRVPAGRLAGEVDSLDGKQLKSLLYTASDLRSALIFRLLKLHSDTGNVGGDSGKCLQARDQNSDDDWSFAVKTRLQDMYVAKTYRHERFKQLASSGLPHYRDAAARLPNALDHPMSAERAMLVSAFEYIHCRPEEIEFLAALHAYLVIQNLVWRALTKPREYAKGFDRFERYHGHFLREVEKAQGRVGQNPYLDRLLQAQRTGGVRWAELRVVPASNAKGGPLRDVRNMDRVLNAPDLRSLFMEKTATQVLERVIQAGTTVGLVFHFIKRKDDSISGYDQVPFHHSIPCRHSILRRTARRQAAAISRAHRNRRLGRYVVGIDAAGPEIEAGPEVFAPVMNWLRSKPTLGMDPKWMQHNLNSCQNFPTHLGLTYHVGEDFRHLVSGLRAVEESMRFLQMRSGDRIGHGLALGLEYRLWCQRVGNVVAMPRGQRLDDLVWMRTRLASGSSVFAGCLFEIDKEIEKLAREIYADSDTRNGCIPTLQVLYEAWKLRYYDPLEMRYSLDGSGNSRSLPRGFAVLDSPGLTGEAFRLYHDYHFDMTQRRKYNEFIRVSLSRGIEEWHLMVTWLQDKVLRDVVRKRIAIEINPTSNLCIGSLAKMTEHPVFRWHPPVQDAAAIRPQILVGSDDPGVFGTELLFEYAALSKAAEERGATPREISEWLGDLRETSRTYCFLDTRD